VRRCFSSAVAARSTCGGVVTVELTDAPCDE
jgi:hypothetical protein